ncbi:MAG: hypothetical protein RRB22_02530 [Gammaproteobacteria bacterium]|nr:hypothetical protein [Gammaproteobacteria bacterium]
MPQYALQNPESLEASAETTLSALLEEIINLRSLVIDGAATRLSPYAGNYPVGQCSDSAQNLAHYLSLRRHDLRPLQERLAQAGLSSLGRCEAHVLGTLNQVANILGRALGAPIDQFQQQTFAERYTQALQTMEGNTRHLFGPRNPEREAYIMVTLPHEAALDAGLVRALIRQGMDCARINCAHDDKDT